MATVYLHGDLQRFGGPFQLDVSNAAEAVRAICSQIKGLRQRLNDGAFRVVRKSARLEKELDVNMFGVLMGAKHELHITPVVAGAGGRGGAKIIIGIALIAAAFAFAPAVVGALGPTLGIGAEAFSILGASVSFSSIAGFGASLVLGGLSMLLSPTPSAPRSTERPDERPSFIFNGAVNAVEQGAAVPFVFGQFMASTVVISSSLTTEQI